MLGYYTAVSRFYDMEHAGKTNDLAMYTRLAGEHGVPILDVGCGTGRVMLHLVQEGYEVHGIDKEPAMLDRFERKITTLPRHLRDKLHFQQGDVLTYDFDQRFKLTLLTYNALMHFHEQDTQLALLRRLRACTLDNGLLVIDLPNAGESFGAQETDALIVEQTFIDPETGHLVMLQSNSYVDRVTQMLRADWIYDEITGDGTLKRTFTRHLLRYYFYPEIRLLLMQSGFEAVAVYGDEEEAPFEDGCERMIVYARPV